MDDKDRGLYLKYSKVERTDGSSKPGGKHEHCRYFILDLDHDKHAKAALGAYAESCKGEYPALAADLKEAMTPDPPCPCRSAGHEACGRFLTADKPSFGA